MDVKIDFNSKLIGHQSYSSPFHEVIVNSELAPARTFGLIEQLNTLHKLGLAMGATLKNAVLIDNDKIVNQEGLRFKDEFVRHKVTDVIGDIGLLGARLIGQFSGLRNGHQINNELLQKLMVQEHTWQYISLREVNARWREFMVFANKLTTQNKYSETRIGRYLN